MSSCLFTTVGSYVCDGATARPARDLLAADVHVGQPLAPAPTFYLTQHDAFPQSPLLHSQPPGFQGSYASENWYDLDSRTKAIGITPGVPDVALGPPN